MRVLHLDSGREMRGGQLQALRLIEGLLARGTECRLLAREGTPLYREAARRGWSVGPLGWARVLFERGRYDLVHAHDARSHTLAAAAAVARLAVARRVAFAIRPGWKYGRAARYIAVSRHVAGILGAGGVPADRIAVVYDGVPLPPVGAERTGAIAPATNDPGKGAALASRAAELAGTGLRFSADLERDLPSAAVLLYLSESEGLGSGALLGMASGAAVVASRVGGLVEAIEDGVTGLLVENTAEAVAAALRRLADDPALARRLGRNARETAAARFSVEAMVEGTMAVYREIGAGAGA